jgi:hypothetical protein
MKQLVALFDMDDTLCDTTSQKIREVEKYLPNEKNFSVNYCSPECTLQIRNLLRHTMSQPGWWQNLPKLNDGFELYDLMRSEGINIEIVTKMPETYPLALWEKLSWCKKNTPDADNINLTLKKRRYPGDLLIDDWPDYVTAWLDYNKEGRAILPLRKWNKDYKSPRAIHYNGENIEQVKSLIQALKSPTITAKL